MTVMSTGSPSGTPAANHAPARGHCESLLKPSGDACEMCLIGSIAVIVAGACPLWDDLHRSAIVAVRQPSRGAGFADVAQLVAHHLAKVRVAGSNPVVRSEGLTWSHLGGLLRWSGREARQRPAKPSTRVQIPSPPRSTSTQAVPAHTARAIGAVWLARFPDTEEVTGSSPVSPTEFDRLAPRSNGCVGSRDGLNICRLVRLLLLFSRGDCDDYWKRTGHAAVER